MNTDRADTRSVNLLASGQISADEAAQRLRPSAAPQNMNLNGRWLRVRVTDLHTGKQKVNVNLPLAWVEAGIKIGAQYRPDIANLDLGALVEQIQAGTEGKLVEVEDMGDNERVEIFVV